MIQRPLVLIVSLAAAIWLLGSVYWYDCGIKKVCGEAPKTPTVVLPVPAAPVLEPKVAPRIQPVIPAPLVIYFDNGEALVRDEQFGSRLSLFIDAVEAIPNARIQVVGYTDGKGRYGANVVLAKHRADAFAKLIRAEGFAEELVDVSSLGPQEPVADNHTVEGRALNRRAVATVVIPP